MIKTNARDDERACVTVSTRDDERALSAFLVIVVAYALVPRRRRDRDGTLSEFRYQAMYEVTVHRLDLAL